MTRDELRAGVLAALHRVAPEVDPATIDSDVALRDQVDLDSIDFVNFVIELDERFGVDVPERDYPLVATLGGCVDYLERHGAAPRAPRAPR